MLEYCWLFTLLLRSARYFTGVEGKSVMNPLEPQLGKGRGRRRRDYQVLHIRAPHRLIKVGQQGLRGVAVPRET